MSNLFARLAAQVTGEPTPVRPYLPSPFEEGPSLPFQDASQREALGMEKLLEMPDARRASAAPAEQERTVAAKPAPFQDASQQQRPSAVKPQQLQALLASPALHPPEADRGAFVEPRPAQEPARPQAPDSAEASPIPEHVPVRAGRPFEASALPGRFAEPGVVRVEVRPAAAEPARPVAGPLAALPGRFAAPLGPGQLEAPPPVVHVTIGRVEVRAVAGPAQSLPANRPRAVERRTRSLEEYLRDHRKEAGP